MSTTFQWDVFISHATEDKVDFVVPLVEALERRGLSAWFDQCVLNVGDSLRAKIDEGLSSSRYGAVVLSPFFFAKQWPQRELDGLFARERLGHSVLLPVWHNVSRDDVLTFSPLLASRIAVSSAEGIEKVADALHRAIKEPGTLAGSPGGPMTGASATPRLIDLARDDDGLTRFYK